MTPAHTKMPAHSKMLLSSTSAFAVAATLASMSAFPAVAAPVTFDTGTQTLTNDNNTTTTPGTPNYTITTNGLEDQGAYLTGNGTSATYTWNFTNTADLTVAAATMPGFLIDTSAGSQRVNFDGLNVIGNDEAGIKINNSGTSSLQMTINTGTTVQGGATGATAAGIYIDSTSTTAPQITIDATSSVTNGGGAAGIDVVQLTNSFFGRIENSGAISGGTGDGHGIYLHQNALLRTLNNNTGGTITGGATGTSHGLLVESNNGFGSGLNTFTNYGTVMGGATLGDGIAVRSTGIINSFNNYGTVDGGAGDSSGVSLSGTTARIDNLSNQSTGVIDGGAGTGYGVVLDDNTSIGTLSNRGVIDGGDTAGSAIYVHGSASIDTIGNYSAGVIGQDGTGAGYGILVQGDAPGDTATVNNIYNYNDIFSRTGNAAIGLLGGDSTTAVITSTINNYSTAVISGVNGGNGLEVGNYHELTYLNNAGNINGNNATGGGVYVSGHGSILHFVQSVNSASVTNTAAGGYGILVESTGAGDTAYIEHIFNARSTISGGDGGAGIGLFGGDATTTVTTLEIYNFSSASILGTNGGDGVRIGAYQTLLGISNNALISGNGATGEGVLLSGNSTVNTIANGFSIYSPAGAKIAGSNATAGGTAIHLTDSSTVGSVSNYGTISSFLNADSADGNGIFVEDTSTLTTIDNRGTIKGGTTTGTGIKTADNAVLTTINNYSLGTISGATAIGLGVTGSSTTINSAGTISGDVVLGSTTGNGDALNIYGGSITGNVLGADNLGTYGVLNFNLVGGTFGTGGVSVAAGTATVTGDIGQTANRLKSVDFNSGTTTINGDMYAVTSTVDNGAAVTWSGNNKTISGALVNNGTFTLGANHLTVGGDISGSGTLGITIQAGAGGSHGYITNTGSTASFSSLTIAPTYGAGDVVAGETLVIVQNPATLTYSALGMQSLNGIKWTLSEAGTGGADYQGITYNAGSLLATAGILTTGIATPNATSVDALSNYSGTDTDILALQAGLTSATNNDQAGAQLRPDANGGGVLAALNVSKQAKSNIAQHMGTQDGAPVSGVASGDAAQVKGVWVQAYGSWGEQGRMHGVDGFEAESYGATFGMDKQMTPDTRVGLAFTYGNSEVDDKGTRAGSGEELDSYVANAYGNYDAGDWYASGIATAGLHSYDTRRRVNFTGNTLARGEFDSQQYGLQAEVGRPLVAGDVTITPFATFAYDTLMQDGYTERGAGGSNLVVGDSTLHSYRATVGAKAYAEREIDEGLKLKHGAYITATHEFNDELIPTQSVAMQAGGVQFSTAGLELPQDSIGFGLDVGVISGDDMTITARYDGEYRSGYTNHAAMLKARFEF